MASETTESNRRSVKAFYTALFAGDTSKASDLIGPEFVSHEPLSLPYGGDYRGLDGFFKMMTALREAWRGMRFEIERYSADADLVFVHIKFTATGRESGLPIDTRLIEMWRLEGGKAIEQHVFFFDTKMVVDALAGVAEPSQA